VKNGMEIVPVSRMDQVLERALTRMPEPIEWEETLPPPRGGVDDDRGVVAH
jgi:ATP-dependent Lon protease